MRNLKEKDFDKTIERTDLIYYTHVVDDDLLKYELTMDKDQTVFWEDYDEDELPDKVTSIHIYMMNVDSSEYFTLVCTENIDLPLDEAIDELNLMRKELIHLLQ